MSNVGIRYSMPPALAAAFASTAIVVPVAMSMSSTPSPDHPAILVWYKALRQPRFKPPDWVFPVAWTAIESSLAFGAYRLLRSPPSPARTKALGLWAWNVVMIGGWSRLFFKRHRIDLSSLDAAALAVTSVAFVREAYKVDKPTARFGIPLVGWVAFATVLTATIWRLNSHRRL